MITTGCEMCSDRSPISDVQRSWLVIGGKPRFSPYDSPFLGQGAEARDALASSRHLGGLVGENCDVLPNRPLSPRGSIEELFGA